MPQDDSRRSASVRRFANEPPVDFSRGENRDAMQRALAEVREQFGDDYPLVINGKAIDTRPHIVSRNPSHRSEVVGSVASASVEHAAQAVDAARDGPGCSGGKCRRGIAPNISN